MHRLWEVMRLNREKPTEREKGRKTVDVQPLTIQKKTLVSHLPFNRSTLTAQGDLHEQREVPALLRSPRGSAQPVTQDMWVRGTGAGW